MKTTVIIGIASLLSLSACISPPREKTGLELQAIQKREFEANKKVVFASTISVFQDLGYIIKSADLNTGFFQAQSPTKSGFIPGAMMSKTEVSGFIEELSEKKTSLRLNFVETIETSTGNGVVNKQDHPIHEDLIYRNAFQKIEEAIFIRTNTK